MKSSLRIWILLASSWTLAQTEDAFSESAGHFSKAAADFPFVTQYVSAERDERVTVGSDKRQATFGDLEIRRQELWEVKFFALIDSLLVFVDFRLLARLVPDLVAVLLVILFPAIRADDVFHWV